MQRRVTAGLPPDEDESSEDGDTETHEEDNVAVGRRQSAPDQMSSALDTDGQIDGGNGERDEIVATMVEVRFLRFKHDIARIQN